MKPTLVIAGPGAGKTYDMVKHVIESIPSLDHSRILAVITYTNSATESIKSRINLVADIPPNVFIGTTFSFFNRYIIQPYASIFDDVDPEKVFLEIDIDSVLNNAVSDKKNFGARNAVRKRLMTTWLSRGHIPISEIGKVAANIIQNNKRVREVICNRLQYLFIDEFQDIDTWQFKVFDEIRKGKKTFIYAVGDPEQYISSFTYKNTTARKPKSFTGIPIQKFNANKRYETSNHRSYDEIIQFTNRFHTEIDQESTIGSCTDSGVYFISSTDIDSIIQEYQTLIDRTKWRTVDSSRRFFYLAFENKVFGDYATKHNLTQISTISRYSPNPIELAKNYLSVFTGLPGSKLMKTYNLSPLQFRELAVKLVRMLHYGHLVSEEDSILFITNTFGLQPSSIKGTVLSNQFNQLQNCFISHPTGFGKHCHSSIHKAKGLEADGVLAVAKTENELVRWFTTDKNDRYNDKSDRCRIGYVAFTRAKQVLCVACLKNINEGLKNRISSYGVKLI